LIDGIRRIHFYYSAENPVNLADQLKVGVFYSYEQE